MEDSVSTVTEKGQATIPKALREKHGIGRKVLVVDTRQESCHPGRSPPLEAHEFTRGRMSRTDLVGGVALEFDPMRLLLAHRQLPPGNR